MAFQSGPTTLVADVWQLVRPGGISHTVHWETFIANHGHFVVEVVLVLIILYLILQKGRPSGRDLEPLTEKEVESLCKEWEPEPLCPPMSESEKHKTFPIVSSTSGAQAVVDGRDVVNFCSSNFLGLSRHGDILSSCKETLQKYGCGSCGPRGFYGTIDVHLELEDRLSRFMGTEEAIIYSYDMSTLPSIIPAFANRKDLIICDESVNFAIQNGCNLSRSRVLKFRHNDVADLRRLMEAVAEEDRLSGKKLNRKYVVVEGIYANTGDIAPLDEIFRAKEDHKYRLIVDESYSLGVLGPTGRGACEHFGILGRAEIVAASMSNALASVGGFCCGDREICDHQRLSGSGYCFSASLPPFLATAALRALDVIEDDGAARISAVQANAERLRALLAANLKGLKVVSSNAVSCASPLIHLRLSEPPLAMEVGAHLLDKIVEHCLEGGVLLSVNTVSRLDASKPAPSIRVAVTAEHTEEDLAKIVDALVSACSNVLNEL
mmetsp:Transcript_5160/g.12599  ORF Transcript_5160/g.12599 Transcript_5160/m.12599 type:complete len:493 (+) Transcript_5160:89-1567(+)